MTTGLLLTVAPAQAHRFPAQRHSPFAPQRVFTGPGGDVELRAACPPPASPYRAACFAIVRGATQRTVSARGTGTRAAATSRATTATERAGAAAERATAAAPRLTPHGYGPPALKRAYNLPTSRGSGRVVAVVDAYDDPEAESDLATYRRTFGLPACTTANGCFRKVNQRGGHRYSRPDADWAAEISLDLDMVSAVCPRCHILLAEASSDYLSDLGKAVNTAVRLGARFVSNSYGAAESWADSSYDSQYFRHPGVAITAAAGDGGYATSYPADSGYVTAVGGTTLKSSRSARGWSERVWHGTGSGCSSFNAKPPWQRDSGCGRRTGNDVAAVADPDTGVAVYDTYRSNGWQVYGGTSVAAPIIAAAYALAGTPDRGSYPVSYPYAHRSALHDVTRGRNGSCRPSYLCAARTGYDGPTGLGTPEGTTAFRA